MTVEEANTLFWTQKGSSSEEVARLWQAVDGHNSAESAGGRPSRIADSTFFFGALHRHGMKPILQKGL